MEVDWSIDVCELRLGYADISGIQGTCCLKTTIFLNIIRYRYQKRVRKLCTSDLDLDRTWDEQPSSNQMDVITEVLSTSGSASEILTSDLQVQKHKSDVKLWVIRSFFRNLLTDIKGTQRARCRRNRRNRRKQLPATGT